MNETVPAADEIREASLEALTALGVTEVEMEVSLMEVDYLVELAQGGEVMPIDTSDPAGGFGGADLWINTVAPALTAALGLRRAGALTWPALDAAIDEMVLRVGSPRAKRERTALARALRSAVGITAPRRGDRRG